MSSRIARLAATGALVAVTLGAARPAVQPITVQASTTYTIGVSLPFNELAELANGISHGVQVAVKQANASHMVPGVTFQVKTLDDTLNGQHDGAKDAANGLQFIDDATVFGEVGPLNSSAAKVSAPTYNRAGLAQISPSNTNPDLTARAQREQY